MDHHPKVPIPRLERQNGVDLQDKGFLEPAKPSQKGGAGSFRRFIKSRTTTVPKGFGSLTKVFEMSVLFRGEKSRLKPDTNVFLRKDRGNITYDLWRGDGARYEDRKFNILQFPSDNGKNHWAYGQGLAHVGLDNFGKTMLKMAQWPYCPNVKTKVIYFRRG